MKLTLPLILTLIFSLTVSTASEIDSFTQRYEPMADSLPRINETTNALLQKALDEANARDDSCQEEGLYHYVRQNLGGALWGNLENLLVADPQIEKKSITRSHSIFGQLGFFDSFPLYLVNLGAIMNVGGHIIGSDKFGHFFEEGYVYFDRAYLKNLGVEAALQYGEETEGGRFGMATTGIYSYGDLVANYHGMEFWKSLREGRVECREGEWVLVRPMDWAQYLDPAWDEGINCNRYRGGRFEQLVEEKIKTLEELFPQRFNCPVDVNLCRSAVEKYAAFPSPLLEKLISPGCLNLP